MKNKMDENINKLPVNIYCLWQWWEKHYQVFHGRPDMIDFDWLDTTYLGRQRQLYEWFGVPGIGSENPELDKDFVSMVMPYHTMIVPAILGMELTIQREGGWHFHPFNTEQAAKLKPVDLADSPVGELLVAEREKRIAHYGTATQMIDLGSAANNGFTLRGTEFYLDLLADPPLAKHYMEVVTETMVMAYRFISQHFGKFDSVPLANCNVTMISPKLYADMINSLDIRFIKEASASQGVPPVCDLHHCSVRTEPFSEVYRSIPGLRSLQGAVDSDIRAIHAALPDVKFSGMINPSHMLKQSEGDLLGNIDHAVESGVNDLVLWDVDPSITPAMLGEFLKHLSQIARRHGREPEFSFIPITWEEMDWEFPQYH